MTNSHYSWQRFWIPRGKTISLSKGGYLSGERKYFNPEIRTLPELLSQSCLVLLGEPGLGKSRTINYEYQTLAAQFESADERYHLFNLNTYRSEELLVNRLFESQWFGEWVNGTHRLHLFLDGLDECLLRIDTVASLLVEEFRKYPKDRLFLRIACRSADWPPSLENGLGKLWGKEVVTVYELCPLQEEDVTLAAKVEQLNAEDFLAEVSGKEAVPFAAKPVTLDFLLGLYRHNGQLPNTQAALYERGCRLLADESNQSYRDTRAPRQLTADQRMLVAGRIAAITIFSNKAAIWQAVDRGEVGAEDVTVRELCGFTESLSGQTFEVTEAAIRETLGTGLFSLRDENRMGWAHQTYAEFLAAWYLNHRQIAPAEAMQLLTVEQDVSGRVAPQLHETAARLAGLIPEVFQQVMQSDPDVLLRSDVAAVSPAFREALVAALLEVFQAEQASDDWFNRDHYRKLAHPKLAEQLRPIISGKNENFLVRRVAIDISEDCELQAVQGELAMLALDQTDFLPTRIQAACAISKIGDKETRATLKPLVNRQAGDDPHNELLGYGLKSLWPEMLTANEVFASLVEPIESFFGAYNSFLEFKFVPHLKLSDMPFALEWVANQQYRLRYLSSLKRMGDQILIKAWDFLDIPEILRGFAHAVFNRLKAHHEILDTWEYEQTNPFAADDDKRRCVLRAMMSHIEDTNRDWIFLTRSRFLSLERRDAFWLLEILATESSEIIQDAVSRLLARFFNHSEVEPEYLSAISEVCQNNKTLAAKFTFFVELVSPQAQEAKSIYEMEREYERQKEVQQKLQPLAESPLLPLLEQFEQGDLSAWWKLNLKLVRQEHESDLMATANWHRVDEATTDRIIAAAKRYVLEADPETSQWLGTNTIYRPAFAGYRALLLLVKIDSTFVAQLSPEVWRKWATIIITYPLYSNYVKEGESLHLLLVNLAYLHASEVVIETLLFQIEQQNEGNEAWLDFDRLKDCWDSQLRNALLAKAKDERLSLNLFRQLLQQLLANEDAETEAFTRSLLTLPLATEGEARERATIAAQELLIHKQDAAWEILWPIIQEDTEFGRHTIEAIVDRPHDRGVITRLNEQAAADLYIWLCHQYPHSEDIQHTGGYAVTTRDSMARWRDAIPNNLMNRGTAAACAALEKIILVLPHLEWLKFILLDAQKNTRREEWSPLPPETLIAITVGGKKLPRVNSVVWAVPNAGDIKRHEQHLVIDNESREQILVGEVTTITAAAGQIYRGYTNSDHGIDGEIEFKDDTLRASGKRLYMQLKSGDSYLTKRKRDGAEIFQIKKKRWVQYWQQQAYPVMLVIRNSEGEIRWMDVTEYLRRESDNGKKPVKQIIFQGERFDVMSVRRWRDKILA